LKDNPKLKKALLDDALTASLKLNQLDRTKAALAAFQALASGEGDGAGQEEILVQLDGFIRPQMDDLRRRGDPEAVKKAKDSFTKLVDEQLKAVPPDKSTNRLKFITARLDASLDKHKEAADLLGTLPDPKPLADAINENKEEGLFRAGRILLIRELRLTGDPAKARKLMDAIPTDKEKKEWGAGNVDVRIENIRLLGAEGKPGDAAVRANALVKLLLPKIASDNQLKRSYQECYLLLVENAYRQAQLQSDKDKAAKGVKDAAELIVDLEKRQLGFGDEGTRRGYQDLLDAEPALKAAYLDACVAGAEGALKQSQSAKEAAQREHSLQEAAALVGEAEKLWPDFGGADPKKRFAELLAKDDLKKAYEQFKGGDR
jgi:hypothetical protein